MKITKQRLKEIIKEELQTALQEGGQFRRGSQKIQAMGYALSDTEIEDLAQNDRDTLGVYDALLQSIHPGVMTQRIKAAYEDSPDATRSWEDYLEYVRKTLTGPSV